MPRTDDVEGVGAFLAVINLSLCFPPKQQMVDAEQRSTKRPAEEASGTLEEK